MASITSKELVQKAVQAALAAIEVYNKPDFNYREETFAVLMCNAWELLLKAKVLVDNAESFASLVVFEQVDDPQTGQKLSTPKLNRSKNPMTHGAGYIADRMIQSKVEGFSKECLTNLELLTEIRDNAVHLACRDPALSREVLGIGTASVRNFVSVAQVWFGVDFSRYNFFLMPISFFPAAEEAVGVPLEPLTAQTANLLMYLAETAGAADEQSAHAVTMRIETKVVKVAGRNAIPIQFTRDESAPQLRVSEESLLAKYPYDSTSLSDALRERYETFKKDRRYYDLKKMVEAIPGCCLQRLLDPRNSRSGTKKFFSTQCFQFFDQHYAKKSC